MLIALFSSFIQGRYLWRLLLSNGCIPSVWKCKRQITNGIWSEATAFGKTVLLLKQPQRSMTLWSEWQKVSSFCWTFSTGWKEKLRLQFLLFMSAAGKMITFTIYLHMLTRTAPESPPEWVFRQRWQAGPSAGYGPDPVHRSSVRRGRWRSRP